MGCRRVAVAIVLSLTGWLVTETAVAQTVTSPTGTAVERRTGRDLTEPERMNREDCVRNEGIDFTLTVDAGGADLDTYALDVWVGAGIDCGLSVNRTGTGAQCWKVRSVAPTAPSTTMTVYVRDIVARASTDAPGTTPVDICTPTTSSRGPQSVTLYFLLLSGGTASDIATPANWAATYDLLGPPQPTSVNAGVGERALVVSWKEPNTAGNLNRYRLCWEALATVADPDAGSAGAGTDGGTAAAACTSVNLVPGDPAPDPLPSGTHCKNTDGLSTSDEATGLRNGVRYVVAVAAVDDYENPGNLSNLDCATPEPVTGFYEQYRSAGGGGGGGFCALGARRAPEAAAGFAFALLGLVARRRLRRAQPTPGTRGPA